MKRKTEAYWNEKLQRWQINVQKDGKRKTFVCSAANCNKNSKKGKIEAERKADMWLENVQINNNDRIDNLIEKYKNKLMRSTTQSHYRQYFSILKNHIQPAIGHKRIKNLKEMDLQNIIDNVYYQRDLAEKTLINIKGCITNFIKFCRLSGVTKLHPEGLSIPKSAKQSDKKIFSPADLVILFSKDRTTHRYQEIFDHYIYVYRFMTLTGLRPGEAIGLKYSDIKNEVVTIKRSINYYGEETQGKNKSARRPFKLSDMAKEVLKQQDNYLKSLGIKSDYIFVNENGETITQQYLNTRLQKYCRYNNLENVLTPYELRHTFNSINDDMPDRLRKMVMGHSKSMDTNRIYSHQKQGDLDKIANYTDEAFLRILDNKKRKVCT